MSQSEPFVDQLAALCAEQPTRDKWVFVPAHGIGRTIGERIALQGTNWLNLRFVTPLDVALRMGAPFLVERGIDPSEEGLGPALMMRLLLDLPIEGGYFRPLADQPTMAEALWATVRELRMAGVKAADLKAAACESPAKHAELQALLGAYEEFLAENARADMAAVYEEALAHPDWCPIQKEDCWTELPDVLWTPLQRRVIDAMPGERVPPRALALPGTTVPRRLAGAVVSRVAPDERTHPLAFLMSPGDRPTGKASPIDLFHAGGREAEIDEVFRRILASGVPLDRIEIACASASHLALVWEKALRHEWKVTIGAGLPATATRPGRALIGLSDWIETDFSAAHLRHLLQSGDMGLEKDDEGFTQEQAAALLARADAGWGRATYQLTLGALRAQYDARAEDGDRSDQEREDAARRAELTAGVLSWISTLIGSVPEPGEDGRVSFQPIVEAAAAYVERSTARVSQLDHRAGAALVEHVLELRALGEFSCTLVEGLRFIRERVQSLHVAAERPRPGHVHACTLGQAGYSGRPLLFVAGLEEGRVFPVASEDPVLLDRERESISSGLRLSSDRIDEAVYGALARLAAWTAAEPEADASAPPRVTLSYSTRDTREFRETFASWVMLQAFRLQSGSATASYRHLKDALGEPASSAPSVREASASASGWWLRSVVGSGAAGVAAVETSYAGVARGRKAEAARNSTDFTEFDGYVPDAGLVLDPTAPGNVYSVTELEGAATCPFRFFLKRGLGLRPLDDGERERDIWLDPLTRGSVLHDIYAALLRRARADGRPPHVGKDGAWLTELAQGHLDGLRQAMPPATAEIFEREAQDFLADVDLFLEGECEASSVTAVALEVSFGRPPGDDPEPLAREAPVQIDLGGGLMFSVAGRIDRIDQVAPGVFEVLDYKTGGYYRDDWAGTFNGGRRLQHALYGLAAVEILRAIHPKPVVKAGVYYFSSHRGRRERLRIPTPDRRQIAKVLGDLREVISGGAFVHTPTEKDCTFCDFTRVCGTAAHLQAEGKQDDPKLKAYWRLVSHA